MADVIDFPRPQLRVVCSESNQQALADAAFLNALLPREANIACPSCCGRGVLLYKHPITRLLVPAPCPCGGTDEDRIHFDNSGGAA